VTICDAENLARVSAALNAPAVRLEASSFELVLGACGPEDFVYLDPPYAPLTGTARFTSYTAGGFGPDRQHTLQRAVVELAARGGLVLLSNSSAPEIRQLYAANAAARRAGLRARFVHARRAINSRGTGRAGVREYLITNVQPRAGQAPFV
jgi:DNA adenine methylase